MAKKDHNIAGVAGIDPTLPNVRLEANGKSYQLVYDYGAIARAERELNATAAAMTPRGATFVRISLLHGFDLDAATAEEFRGLVYAALLPQQPKITLAEVDKLLTFANMKAIYDAIVRCWLGSQPEPGAEDKDKNPTPDPS